MAVTSAQLKAYTTLVESVKVPKSSAVSSDSIRAADLGPSTGRRGCACRGTAPLLLLAVLSGGGCHQNGAPGAAKQPNLGAQPQVRFLVPPHDVTVAVEVARDPQDRARGLMFRTSLDALGGMIFIFDEEAIHPFWMKNTYIPLDMIFISEAKIVVGVLENVPPRTTTSRSVDLPSRYVVEVNAGFARAHRITVGTHLIMQL